MILLLKHKEGLLQVMVGSLFFSKFQNVIPISLQPLYSLAKIMCQLDSVNNCIYVKPVNICGFWLE